MTRDLGPQVAAGLQLLSTAALVDPRAIEPAQEARGAIARGLAQQWFGVYIRPATHSDAWLVEGAGSRSGMHAEGIPPPRPGPVSPDRQDLALIRCPVAPTCALPRRRPGGVAGGAVH